MFKNQRTKCTLAALLLVVGVSSLGGCRSHESGCHFHASEEVGTVSVEVRNDEPELSLVVIHVAIREAEDYVRVYGIAHQLARESGVLTVNGDLSIALPYDGRFRGVVVEGDIVTMVRGHDSALSRVDPLHWVITIPVSDKTAILKLRNGGSVQINSQLSESSSGAFRGFRFLWKA